MATFTYIASYGAMVKKQPRVRSINFGDGYEQRATFGINNNPRLWTLEFNGKTGTEADAIDNFLTARAGVEKFDWTPPTGSAGKWICRAWNRSIVDSDIHNISASFEEVFEV
jgi:phage-related protein